MPNLNISAGRDGPVMDFHEWKEDFDLYLGTSWAVTESNSGTRAIAQAKDGILVCTPATADDDNQFLQARDVASGQVAEHWKFVLGKRLYFGIRLKVSDATQSDVVAGLQITDTSPLAVSDGIFFRKDDDARTIKLVGCKNGVESTIAGVLGTSGYMTDDTFTVLEFYYDGVTPAIQAYQDGVGFGSIPLTNVVDDEELAVSFGVQNGSAGAKPLSIDWIRVLQERG